MAETLARYYAPVHAMNLRLKVGGGMLTLIVFGEGLLAYIHPLV